MSDSWEQLESECRCCHECSLCQTRTNVVFGTGSRSAEVLFVGEGPGAREDAQGLPFVGPAGQLLDQMLTMIGMHREEIYIANIVKCRPPQNRDPLNTEQEACIGYLYRQMQLLQPKLMVCLGRISAMRFISPEFRITREHGQWYTTAEGIPIMATYHPAALLRSPERKPEAFQDLKQLQRKVRELCLHTSCR